MAAAGIDVSSGSGMVYGGGGGNLINNGTIVLNGSALSVGGTLSGSGIVQAGTSASVSLSGLAGTETLSLAANASVTLNGTATGGTIAFAGSGAVLTIGYSSTYNYSTGTYTYAPYPVAATLTGFATGDGIIVNNEALTGAVYTAGTGTTGTLALLAGTNTVETLALQGNYAGDTFFVEPTSSGGSEVILIGGGGGGSGPVSTTTDSYVWIGSSGGSWGNVANWGDVTTGSNPAIAVPGSLDSVTIAGPAGSVYEVIGGGGAASALTVTGLVELVGGYQFVALNAGTVTLSGSQTVGNLTLGNGTTIQSGSVTVADGGLLLGGGSALTVNGAVALGSAEIYSTVYPYSYTPAEAGTISVTSAATLAASGNVVVSYGTVSASGTGGLLEIGGNLVLGTAQSSVSSTATYAASGIVSVANGATVAVAGGITSFQAYGNSQSGIYVSGADSRLTAGGTLTLDSSSYDQYYLNAYNGGVIQAAALALTPSGTSGYYDDIGVNGTSSIEIGTAGSAAAGALTIDAGQTVTAAAGIDVSSGSGMVYGGGGGNLINNGTIVLAGSLLSVSGTLSGSGIVQAGTGASVTAGGLAGGEIVSLGANASLTLNGTATGGTIAFAGSGAVLTIGYSSTYNYSTGTYIYAPYPVAATLTGFANGDGIIVNNEALTGAVYTAGSNNTGSLALLAGTATVETLALQGNYAGRVFFLSPTTGGATEVSLLAQPGNNAPSTEAVLVGATTTLSGFSVNDSNTGAASITVTLAATLGHVSASAIGGATVTGAGSTNLTIAGSVTQVNAALATLSYLANSAGSDTITLSAVNSLGSTALASSTAVSVLTATAPSINVPAGTIDVRLSTTGTIAPVSITDTDALIPGEQVTVTLSNSYGLLSVNGTIAGGGGTVAGSGTTRLSITGSALQVNQDLTTLTYQPGSATADTLTVSASSGVGGAATPETIAVQIAHGATLALTDLSSSGTLSQTGSVYTLDLGTIARDSSATTVHIGAENIGVPIAELAVGRILGSHRRRGDQHDRREFRRARHQRNDRRAGCVADLQPGGHVRIRDHADAVRNQQQRL